MITASLLASATHSHPIHHNPNCHKLYTVHMGHRAADAVYRDGHTVTHENLRLLGRIEMCQQIPRNQAVVRSYDRRLDHLHKQHVYTADRVTSSWTPPWDCIAKYESGGDAHADTGNGYYGGLQFTMQTWEAYGGTGNPADASIAEQEAVAERVLHAQGWGAWPNTSRMCGL